MEREESGWDVPQRAASAPAVAHRLTRRRSSKTLEPLVTGRPGRLAFDQGVNDASFTAVRGRALGVGQWRHRRAAVPAASRCKDEPRPSSGQRLAHRAAAALVPSHSRPTDQVGHRRARAGGRRDGANHRRARAPPVEPAVQRAERAGPGCRGAAHHPRGAGPGGGGGCWCCLNGRVLACPQGCSARSCTPCRLLPSHHCAHVRRRLPAPPRPPPSPPLRWPSCRAGSRR